MRKYVGRLPGVGWLMLTAVVASFATPAPTAAMQVPGTPPQAAGSRVSRRSRAHSFYGYWGWHVSSYTRSDLHFEGPGYDFTLRSVRAADRPTPFSFKAYLNPGKISIPQYNGRFGFYLTDDFSISVGLDHMKYVVAQDQTVNITGSIDAGASPQFAGVYDGEAIPLGEDFLRFEHTNGLNLVSVEGEFTRTFWTSSNGRNFLSLLYGGGFGVVLPVTDVRLFGNRRNNPVHLAGWGTSTKAGLRIDLFGRFFIQGEVKGGYISLPDVLIDGASFSGRADQTFAYLQRSLVLGVPFRLF